MGVSRQVSARANAILDIFNEDMSLTPIELQKLLYLDYGHYVIATGKQIETMIFQAWQYGPVQPELYQYHKDLKTHYIREKIIADDGKLYHLKNFKITKLTYKLYSDMALEELIEITHRKNGAWEKAYDPNNPKKLISYNDIKKEFEQYKNKYWYKWIMI